MIRRIGLAVLRASLWSVLAGGLVTGVMWSRTSPELAPGFPAALWFGVSWALAFVPSLALELGMAHLLLDRGPGKTATIRGRDRDDDGPRPPRR